MTDRLLCDPILDKIKLAIKEVLLSREQDYREKTLINLMSGDEMNSEIKHFLFEDIFLPYIEIIEFIEILQQKFNIYIDEDIIKRWETIDDCEHDIQILKNRGV